MHFDFTIHRANDVLDDRESQTRTAHLTGAPLIHAIKALEQARKMLLCDADACIGDCDIRFLIVGKHLHRD